MMCSTRKISVFGIVALMLAFAFTGSEALAAPGTVTVNMTFAESDGAADDNAVINAGESVDITFAVTVTAPTDADNVDSDIVIPIPTDWHRALHQPGALAAAGDVTITEVTLDGDAFARRLVVNAPPGAAGSVTFVYRSPAPKIQRPYTWTVSAPRHTITTEVGGVAGPLTIDVGPAADGSGTLALAATSGFLHMQPAPGDAVLAHEGTWLTHYGEDLVLRVTYTPVGTMPENSTVTVTVAANLATFTRLSDGGEVDVSGNVKTRTRAAQSITAVVGPGGIGHTNSLVFTIKKAKAPAQPDPIAFIEITSAISVFSDIDPDGATATETAATPATAAVGSPFAFVVTRKPPVGKATIGTGASAPSPGADSINLIAGANIGAADAADTDDKIWFVFTEADFLGIGRGSNYEIDIPAGWPEPFEFIPATDGATADGAVEGTFEGRTLKGTLIGPADTDTFAGVTRSLQVNKVPTDQTTYTFHVRANAGPHTTMGPIGSPKVEVTVGHGTGTLSVTRVDGTPLTQTAADAPLGDLLIVYTAAGRMLSGGQVVVTLPVGTDGTTDLGWTDFREDNGDAESSAGETSLTGKADLDLPATNVHQAIANINAEMAAGDQLKFLYKAVKVPAGATGTHSFTAQTISFSGATLAGDIKHNIGIGRAPDGGGTLAVAPANADAGDTIDITLTYTAADKMFAGSQVKVFLPTNGTWPSPVGRTSVSTGSPTADATSMTVTTSGDLSGGESIVFTYSDVLLPASEGVYEFTAQSRAHPTDGGLVGLSDGAEIRLAEPAAGSVMLTNAMDEMVTSATPGADLGNLTFTFTAEEDMAQGAQVTIMIPNGWTPPFRGNTATHAADGAIWVEGATPAIDPGPEEAGPWTITATLDAALATDGTLTITYMGVDAPSAEGDYEFTTMASLEEGGALLMVDPSPSVTVRLPIIALKIEADPDPASVFVDESITVTVTLWDAGDGTDSMGQALDPIVVNLDDGDMGGTFDPASLTFARDDHSMSATYTNDSAVETMITASAMDEALGLDDESVAVSVKSGITGKSVDPSPASAGTMVTISATGGAGAQASFSYSYTDENDNTVTVSKGMDPVGEPDDGSQTYERKDHALPGNIPEGEYEVKLTIAGRSDTVSFEVINDQTPPTVSNVKSSEDVVVNGDSFTLSANVALNDSMVALAEGGVTAMLGGLDSTQADPIPMQELDASPGTYFTIVTIAGDDVNEADDDEYTITVTATDRLGNMGTGMVMVTLENDPSELTEVMVTPSTAKAGVEIWVKATGSAGATPTAVIENDESGVIAQLDLDEDPDMAGSYSKGLMLNEAHAPGEYTVTVTLGTKVDDTQMLTIEPPGYEFTLDIPMGRSMIHIPLDVEQVDGVDMEINTVRDLYNALGDAVSYITTTGDGIKYDSYLGDDAPGMAFGDTMIGDDTGLIVSLSAPKSLHLKGEALGMDGSAALNLRKGVNLVGVPLDTGVLSMISDAIDNLLFPGITSILIMEDGEFKTVVAGTDTDGPVMGGRGYIVITSDAVMLQVPGTAWENDGGGTSSAAPIALSPTGTSVLHVRGQLLDEAGMMALDGLNVSVKNLTSGLVLGSTFATDAYDMTFVKFDATAAKVGDRLEIKADSANPLLGIRSVQHVVTAEDVLDGSISLPDLVTYEIPAQTELLANYPNPFNPETWIPFRLAADSNVSLKIYGTHGRLVRSIDVGFTPAAVYEGRSDAIYWDGRNNFGEQVSSGLYFYHLQAGEFSATRRMVIVK